jgi:sugar/nucleoside kinase (ribokinase family)
VIKTGDRVEVEQINLQVGGAATNAAVALARQGLAVGVAITVGQDVAGQAVLDLLDREGIDRSLVQYVHDQHTGYAAVLVTPGGGRTTLVYPGAADQFRHLDETAIADFKPEWAHVSSLAGDYEALRRLFAVCVKRHIKIFFSPGEAELKDPPKLKALLEDVDMLLMSRAEAQQIVAGQTLDELVFHALNLSKGAAITDGATGAVVSDSKTVVRAGIYEDVPVVDHTGAGDAFGAGLLAGLMQGKSLRDAVVLASANASSVVSKVGAKTGILNSRASLHAMPIVEKRLR